MISAQPDLLRRFVATPHHARIRAHSLHVDVMSNDSLLVECLRMELASESQTEAEWTCKILRDTEKPIESPRDISFGHPGLDVKCYSSGTQFVVDRDSREVFGFIVPEDSCERVAESLEQLLGRVADLPLDTGIQTRDSERSVR
jgi:hypothetical protein